MGEGVAVGVPGLVVAQIYLHQANTRLDEAGGHQAGPAESVVAIFLPFGGGNGVDVEGAAHSRVHQQRDRLLAQAVHAAEPGRPVEPAALFIDQAQQVQPAVETGAIDHLGQAEIGDLKA